MEVIEGDDAPKTANQVLLVALDIACRNLGGRFQDWTAGLIGVALFVQTHRHLGDDPEAAAFLDFGFGLLRLVGPHVSETAAR